MTLKICFSKELYGKLLNKRATVRGQSKLYILGKNSDGICVYSKLLKRSRHVDGCHYMPGIDAEVLSEGYYQVAKRGLDFAGFAHLSITDQRRSGWDYMYGGFLTFFTPGTAVVTIGPRHIRGRERDNKNKYSSVRVKVVDLITKPLTLKKEQTDGRSSSKHGNRAIRQVNKTPSEMRSTRRNNAR